MPTWVSHIYFVLGGLVLVCVGVALLINFRGFGKVWDEGLNAHSAYVGKLVRFPWPHNPSLGPTFRPVVGIFAVVVGSAVFLLNLMGMIR
jgi:hypothetical protein